MLSGQKGRGSTKISWDWFEEKVWIKENEKKEPKITMKQKMLIINETGQKICFYSNFAWYRSQPNYNLEW